MHGRMNGLPKNDGFWGQTIAVISVVFLANLPFTPVTKGCFARLVKRDQRIAKHRAPQCPRQVGRIQARKARALLALVCRLKCDVIMAVLGFYTESSARDSTPLLVFI